MAAVATATATASAAGTGSSERRRALPRSDARRLFEPGRATLDDRVAATWELLVAEGVADCPVCGSELLAARPCAGCGSELS